MTQLSSGEVKWKHELTGCNKNKEKFGFFSSIMFWYTLELEKWNKFSSICQMDIYLHIYTFVWSNRNWNHLQTYMLFKHNLPVINAMMSTSYMQWPHGNITQHRAITVSILVSYLITNILTLRLQSTEQMSGVSICYVKLYETDFLCEETEGNPINTMVHFTLSFLHIALRLNATVPYHRVH